MSTTAPQTLFEKIEAVGHEALTAVEHGAAWLVGTVATAEQSLSTLEANSPLVKTAIDAGIASAQAHGVPVGAIETIGEEILALAKQFAGSLTAPPPAPSPAAAAA